MITPGSGFNLTFDAYNIVVKDRIGITSSVTVTGADQQALLALGLPTALYLGQVNYFTNGFRTRTQGFDIVLSHRTDTGIGRFNSSLAINYNKTKVIDRRSIVLSAIRPIAARRSRRASPSRSCICPPIAMSVPLTRRTLSAWIARPTAIWALAMARTIALGVFLPKWRSKPCIGKSQSA